MSTQLDVLARMKEMAEKFAGAGVRLNLPPESTKTLGTEYVAADWGKSLTGRVRFDPKFTNPVGFFQGGFLAAAFDDVMGPLTYMAAGRPVATIEMSLSFLRPFVAKDEFIDIRADVVSLSKNLLVLKAEAHSKGGKLLATAQNHSLVISDENLKK
jgi:uncharacterized protein (TIGR00369 family)